MQAKEDRRIAALVPLRGGSKGIPHKNICDLGGKPLFAWVLESLSAAEIKTYISTDSEEIAESVSALFPEVTIISRPSELATDQASTESVIAHWISVVDVDDCILVQATSPFLQSLDIRRAVQDYYASGMHCLLTVTRKHEFIWDQSGIPLNYDPKKRPRRQEWSGHLVENGAMYIFLRDGFSLHQCRCWAPCTLFEMDERYSIEIDAPNDLYIARCLLQHII